VTKQGLIFIRNLEHKECVLCKAVDFPSRKKVYGFVLMKTTGLLVFPINSMKFRISGDTLKFDDLFLGFIFTNCRVVFLPEKRGIPEVGDEYARFLDMSPA
jgi:hypothetical protein